MRTLGLDIGSKRIGLAQSDALGITAQGLFTLERDTDENVFIRLRELVRTNDISEIVVGLPLNMNGSSGPQAKAAVAFADKLKESLNIPIKLWDERMTTMEVERIMIQADTSRAKRKKKIDKLAAQVMLQSYLSAQSMSGPGPERNDV